ncbi:MAG: metal-dependent hydrolase [Pseudomonadales bacterium]
MLIAHLPSGYILATYLLERVRKVPVKASWVIAAGMLGAVAPDFDMLYFFFVDHGQVHHHRYISHWPLLWLCLTTVSLGWCWLARTSVVGWLLLVFSLGGLLHVILDTLAGDIWWLAPFVDQRYALVTVPARFKPWWLNYMAHWTFVIELSICAWACLRFWRRRQALVSAA